MHGCARRDVSLESRLQSLDTEVPKEDNSNCKRSTSEPTFAWEMGRWLPVACLSRFGSVALTTLFTPQGPGRTVICFQVLHKLSQSLITDNLPSAEFALT